MNFEDYEILEMFIDILFGCLLKGFWSISGEIFKFGQIIDLIIISDQK